MDTKPVRAALAARLETLAGRNAKIAKHLRGEDGRNEADFGDIASFTEGDEVLEGLEDAARAEITEIVHTLRRIDGGTYGVCESCGGDISAGRLAALPHTRHCVKCAP